MANIFQRKGSKIWSCCFRTSNGKRTWVSLRVTDKTKAQLICDTLQMTADEYRHKKQTRTFLRNVLNSIAALAGCLTLKDYTIRDWFTFWVSNKTSTKAETTGLRYQTVIDDFLASLGDRADEDLTELTESDVSAFRDRELEAGLSAAAANALLKIIRACLNSAVRQGHVTYNRADAITLLPKAARFKEAFDRTDVERLLGSTDDVEWIGLIKIGYYVGARLGDCARFTHEDFDYSEKLLSYQPTKQPRDQEKKTVIIPTHPDLTAYLESLPVRTGPIFPRLSKMRVEGKCGLSLTFRALMDKAGITYKSKAPRGKKGRTVHALGFHSLRKAFNTDLANSSVPQEVRQKLIGHASKEVNDLYTELDMKTLRTAIDHLRPLVAKSATTEKL